MSRIHYRPAPGRRVLKRDGTPVRDEGELLPVNTYYARLIADGDLVRAPRLKRSPSP